jgi:hypothetical protein
MLSAISSIKGSMPMPSRLAQLRNDSGVVLGCLVTSAIILGSLVIQKMTTA